MRKFRDSMTPKQREKFVDDCRSEDMRGAQGAMKEVLSNGLATEKTAQIARITGLSAATVAKYRKGANAWGSRGPALTTYYAFKRGAGH